MVDNLRKPRSSRRRSLSDEWINDLRVVRVNPSLTAVRADMLIACLGLSLVGLIVSSETRASPLVRRLVLTPKGQGSLWRSLCYSSKVWGQVWRLSGTLPLSRVCASDSDLRRSRGQGSVVRRRTLLHFSRIFVEDFLLLLHCIWNKNIILSSPQWPARKKSGASDLQLFVVV